jgi:hypothetical protein
MVAVIPEPSVMVITGCASNCFGVRMLPGAIRDGDAIQAHSTSQIL